MWSVFLHVCLLWSVKVCGLSVTTINRNSLVHLLVYMSKALYIYQITRNLKSIKLGGFGVSPSEVLDAH